MNRASVQELDRLLARKRELAALGSSTPEFADRLRELRSWQAARLAQTYRDLHANPRSRAAVEFFLSDLYGPHDFTERDREISRAWRYLRRSLPPAALDALGRAIELEVLTAELDLAMATALPNARIDGRSYARAYRAVGRREARERQIDLAVRAGQDLQRAVRHAWMGALLRAAHGPAHAAGFGVLQDFLERGYAAFRAMGDARPLIEAIRTRETALMEALFAGAEDPFGQVGGAA